MVVVAQVQALGFRFDFESYVSYVPCFDNAVDSWVVGQNLTDFIVCIL